MYKAGEVIADTKIRSQLRVEQWDINICLLYCKTQYSFSTDPNLKVLQKIMLQIRGLRLSSGAEFIVVFCGSINTMPGLPKIPAAENIKLNPNGEIDGLF